MDISRLVHPGHDTDDVVDSRDIRATAPSPELLAAATSTLLQHDSPVPMPTFSPTIPSLQDQEAWLDRVTNDPELYGITAVEDEDEVSLRQKILQYMDQLVLQCRQPRPVSIKVLPERDLRVYTFKVKYKETASFLEYRRRLNLGSSFQTAALFSTSNHCSYLLLHRSRCPTRYLGIERRVNICRRL
jgi:hypothetical protein